RVVRSGGSGQLMMALGWKRGNCHLRTSRLLRPAAEPAQKPIELMPNSVPGIWPSDRMSDVSCPPKSDAVSEL
ncbi:MAG: hypothetical protein QNL02_18855, partial [Paracoccaceae bacterium]